MSKGKSRANPSSGTKDTIRGLVGLMCSIWSPNRPWASVVNMTPTAAPPLALTVMSAVPSAFTASLTCSGGVNITPQRYYGIPWASNNLIWTCACAIRCARGQIEQNACSRRCALFPFPIGFNPSINGVLSTRRRTHAEVRKGPQCYTFRWTELHLRFSTHHRYTAQRQSPRTCR